MEGRMYVLCISSALNYTITSPTFRSSAWLGLNYRNITRSDWISGLYDGDTPPPPSSCVAFISEAKRGVASAEFEAQAVYSTKFSAPSTMGKKRVLVSYGVDIDAVAGWLGSYGGQDSTSDISRGV
jgi:hypothetical protein